MSSDEDATVCSILEGWLVAHGFDGLSCDGCSCFVGNLMPCGYSPDAAAEPCVRVACGSSPECEACRDYDSDWEDGAGTSPGWCAVSEARRDELLDALEESGEGRTCRVVPMDAAGNPLYRKGGWIYNDMSDGCSECGFPFDTPNRGVPRFCPNCGARVAGR